jgi:hypothetical protein
LVPDKDRPRVCLVMFCICVESRAVLCFAKLVRFIKPSYHEIS